MIRLYTEDEVLSRIPEIQTRDEYKSYGERMEIGSETIKDRWESADTEVQNMVMIYSFLAARMLEFEQMHTI